jgi:hypothetical protein
VRLLQKHLLAQAETAIKQEEQLQQLEFQCTSLHEILTRQPGPEVAIQLKTTQDTLKARDKRIKVCHPVVATSAMAVGMVALAVTVTVLVVRLYAHHLPTLYLCGNDFKIVRKKLYITNVTQFSFEVFITV